MRIVKSSRVSSANGRTMGGQLVESFLTPCYALKVIHSTCALAALLPPARAPCWMTYFHIDRSNVFLVTASLPAAPPAVRSKESSATLDRPSIRVGTWVCQAPHAMHALWLIAQPTPGKLHRQHAHAAVAGLADALLVC